jgi:hypothetical protein
LIHHGLGNALRSSQLVADVPPQHPFNRLLWEAERITETAPTRHVTSYPSIANAQLDRKVLASLPIETKSQHCYRIFHDYLFAFERLAGRVQDSLRGSAGTECTGYVEGAPSWIQRMPVLLIPPPSSHLPIDEDRLRVLTSDQLERIKTDILQRAEIAARKRVYFSDLGVEQFGYNDNPPSVGGIVDFTGVYFELPQDDMEWYREETQDTLEEQITMILETS